MWIESLDLDDFGHFDRARISDLDKGLTVIAGPQRAGKTTFMEAIRYLGYGLTSGTNVPPATDRYDVTATVVKDGSRYSIALDGYSNPDVTSLDNGPDLTARELFGDMRKLQYHQIYTFSLDELSLNPGSLGDDIDLSTVLLEASSGGNITDIPDVRDEFSEKAKQIGGKHGRGTYQLKDPLNIIQRGIEERDKAKSQISVYEKKEAEKEAVDKRIDEIEEDISSKEIEQTRIEAVDSGYDIYQNFQEYNNQLESKDVEDVDDFPVELLDDARDLQGRLENKLRNRQDAIREFESTTDSSNPERYRELLIDSRSDIEQFEHERSGWERRSETLREIEERLEEEEQKIKQRAVKLNPSWVTAPLEKVRKADTDLFSQDTVKQKVGQYQSVKEDVNELSQSIQELEDRRDDLQGRIETATETAERSSFRDNFSVAALGVISAVLFWGFLAVTVNPVGGGRRNYTCSPAHGVVHVLKGQHR